MKSPEIDLLAIEHGLVVAPAGCGKTQLIIEALKRHKATKPILVLTHTNAGVAALRERLDRAKVPKTAYRVITIDGWAMRVIGTYPEAAGLEPDTLAGPSYPLVRETAFNLIANGHVNDILQATYSRVFVDEYQDCSITQNAVVIALAELFPTVVLGDPLQAIFTFSRDDRVANWESEVCTYFPLAGELSKPWRWINEGADDLGHWLLQQRSLLSSGQSIDLASAPSTVTWVPLDKSAEDLNRQCQAAEIDPGGGGRMLILAGGREKDLQQKMARLVPGAVTVEAVDLRDLVTFMSQLDLQAPDALLRIIRFSETLMTGFGADDIVSKVEGIATGAIHRDPTEIEKCALVFDADRSLIGVVNLIEALAGASGVRVYRQDLLRCLYRILRTAISSGVDLASAAISVREQNRLVGRTLNKRSVGSPLLLKGLEAEGALVLNGDYLDASNLYVAMTRGSRRLIICSTTQTLSPRY
jgi:hypothetical protein